MSANSFGRHFRITTWGESHGPAIGVVVDGCPAGLVLDLVELQRVVSQRAPGSNALTSPRTERDAVEVLSGLFEGQTTGAPISLVIWNQDKDSSKYEPIKHLYRPGHANYTYLEKYGAFDYRGGGRASARETACRVVAGAIAQQLLATQGVRIKAFMRSMGDVSCNGHWTMDALLQQVPASVVACPDQTASEAMAEAIEIVKQAGDSLGGVIECCVDGMPVGWGDPVYEKLEANLAKAMLTIPASKGFAIGDGFEAARMVGSTHNDAFEVSDDSVTLATNHAGGTLGGISTGAPLVFRVPFKPTSSIRQSQDTVDTQGQRATFQIPKGSRHDPCVAIRAVPVVEAMTALVLVDSWLMNRTVRLLS